MEYSKAKQLLQRVDVHLEGVKGDFIALHWTTYSMTNHIDFALEVVSRKPHGYYSIFLYGMLYKIHEV